VGVDRTEDLRSMPNGVGVWFECHRHMAAFDGRDELEEVPVPDHDVVQAAAVDVASLARQVRRMGLTSSSW
jgi:hypothetical protein